MSDIKKCNNCGGMLDYTYTVCRCCNRNKDIYKCRDCGKEEEIKD